MLAELAVANAAFAVIKEAVANSGDIMAAGSKVFEYFDQKSAIQKRLDSKSNGSVGSSDMEEFMALEQLKNQEAELKQLMIYNGRGGLWNDWLEFQKQAKQKRLAAEQAAIRKRAARIEKAWTIAGWTLIVLLLCVLMIIGFWVAYQLKNR
jgi:hypothetical protein